MLKCEHCEYSQMKRGYIECPLDGCFKSQEWIDEIYNRKDNEIAEQPTADVKEVKSSKWVVDAYDNQDNIVVLDYIPHQHSMPYCSRCKGEALLDGGEEYVASDFCPHCGADMRGDTDG